ncbi:hypothetical protein DFH07DRAFT_784321 [Mycena maculata]|uniref:Uncharacterized protein n=1 Tax=Mycena maculata TaxID=230809 RepID=A0AAD7MKL1_9AGAR|nr:hypothetical protein DFH07DRAFT_784321 [Mycena maculata]
MRNARTEHSMMHTIVSGVIAFQGSPRASIELISHCKDRVTEEGMVHQGMPPEMLCDYAWHGPEQPPLQGFPGYPTYAPRPEPSPADLPPPYALIDNGHTDHSVPTPGAESHLSPNVLQIGHSDYSMPLPNTEPPLVEYHNIILLNLKFSGMNSEARKNRSGYQVEYRANSTRLGGRHLYDPLLCGADNGLTFSTVIQALVCVGTLQMDAVAEEFPSHSPKNETLFAFVKGKTKSGLQGWPPRSGVRANEI